MYLKDPHAAGDVVTAYGSTYIKQEPVEDFSPAVPLSRFARLANMAGLKRKHSSEAYSSPLSPLSPGTLAEASDMFPSQKRQKVRRISGGSAIEPVSRDSDIKGVDAIQTFKSESKSEIKSNMAEVTDIIRAQFGYEILRKHNELRLINSELAKCQTAMEQLRRCHLIPYPVNVPTPSQMVDIAHGKGPAIQWPGESVAKWAPPYGVVDGPYARHLAKWLIPDPVFDGGVPEAMLPVDSRGVRIPQSEFIGKRSTRSGSTQKHGGSLSVDMTTNNTSFMQPHPPVKEKQSLPSCIVKRSDGVTVRLQCLHCERKQFSSTQGFINHCRIAHKVDYKSHDEAGFKCGVPVDQSDLGSILAPPPAPAAPMASIPTPIAAPEANGTVHQLNRADMTESDICSLLLSRISDTKKQITRPTSVRPPTVRDFGGKSISRKSSVSVNSGGKFIGCSETPALSKYLASKNIGMNLSDLMSEVVDDESSDEDDDESCDMDGDRDRSMSSIPTSRSMTSRVATSRPTIILKRGDTIVSRCSSEEVKTPTVLREIDLESSNLNLSPKTVVSHGAPSLVDDSGSEEDDIVSVASGASPAVDVADMSADEDGGDRGQLSFPTSFKRGSSPLKSKFELGGQDHKKGRASRENDRSSSKGVGRA
ncbi:hypothetical protein HOO65_060501 [Ceratocystis lukuohia]|uniref:AHC1-like C2H2 zinc-finger domain-containing protein n=2 Tax=Ceratocystis TaxID=5157 RepID=A0A2C5X6R0_9PEZI|nr:hypothetical protein CFIMG_008182RA00001 [Ceratocystis fimbriata CBS 114723]